MIVKVGNIFNLLFSIVKKVWSLLIW